MHIPDYLYKKIIRVMPIPCIDLLVVNRKGEILLLRRKNDPAKGKWWFPGGRVLLGETRNDAAKRILLNECGIHGTLEKELGTYDIILPVGNRKKSFSHGISTVFKIKVNSEKILLDNQSSEYCWESKTRWITLRLAPFIKRIISNDNFLQKT